MSKCAALTHASDQGEKEISDKDQCVHIQLLASIYYYLLDVRFSVSIKFGDIKMVTVTWQIPQLVSYKTNIF